MYNNTNYSGTHEIPDIVLLFLKAAPTSVILASAVVLYLDRTVNTVRLSKFKSLCADVATSRHSLVAQIISQRAWYTYISRKSRDCAISAICHDEIKTMKETYLGIYCWNAL